MIADYNDASAVAEAEIAKSLLPNQLERLRQIRMNMVAKTDGATFGLNKREFLEYLDLTDAQKLQIETKAAEVNKLVEEKVKKLRAEIQKVQLEARDEVLQILTPQQREKYLNLVGKPFEREPRKGRD